jgi:uncharacterized protein (TIGR00369 family)
MVVSTAAPRQDDAMSDPGEPRKLPFKLPNGVQFDPEPGARQFARHGHTGFLGMEYSAHGEDWMELAMPWREDLVGVEETGVLASGPIISLLDNATSMAVWTRLGVFSPQVTLDLRIDYVRAATPGKTIIARAECYQVSRSMAFVRGIAHDGDANDPVAHTAGIFMMLSTEEWTRT